MKDDRAKFSLLLVDDEPSVHSSLKRIFHKENYLIYTAFDGYDALEILKKTKIDAALIDLKMPKMDGLALLKEIKEEYPDILAVVLTGVGDIRKTVLSMKLGAYDFLEKPLSGEALRARVAQLYRIWKLQEENRYLRNKIKFQFGFDPLIGNETQNVGIPSDDSLAAYERAAIRNALSKSDGKRKRAAQILGIEEANLDRKMKKYQI